MEPKEANESQICGAMVQSRKKVDRVGIWSRDAYSTEIVKSIGHKYRDLLKPTQNQRLKFQSHKSGQLRNGSHACFQYEL